jgi:putative transposase
VPRRPRRHLPNGLFHITSRGGDGSLIFLDNYDRRRFVLLLAQVCELWGWRVIAWCLLGTHYHLIVEAKREQMSHAVHRLNGLYAQGFNRRHERRGHLFENRFSSWVIADEKHLNVAIAYVLENPVSAGLCAEAQEWMWSWSEIFAPADLAVPSLAV